MSIQMFNITQTILGSVYASKEAAAKLNSPQTMQRHAAARAKKEHLKQPKQIVEPEKIQEIHLDPEKDRKQQEQSKHHFGDKDEQHRVDEYSLDEFPPEGPEEHTLGDHIDIMS